MITAITQLPDIKLPVQLNECQSGVIKSLLYFNIFNHPLTIDEIHKYTPFPFSLNQLKETIDDLLIKGLIFKTKEYYSITNDVSLFTKRDNETKNALSVMPKARFYSRLISSFPFVRGVFISGSLSKGVLREDGDVDFFIITSGNRLWICRTLLILFKKILLLNSHKYFCLNYFVEESDLLIRDQNIFTAIEIESLMPMHNFSSYLTFKKANSWTSTFLPNVKEAKFDTGKYRVPFFKKSLEYLFSSSPGSKLNYVLQKQTLQFWKRKHKHSAEINFMENIKVNDTVAKYHPNRFQQKILHQLEQQIAIFEATTGYKLS